MTDKICLRQIGKEEFQVISCETGLPTSIQLSRKKRPPTAYNIFMGECIKKKSGAIQKRFKECAIEYKKEKKK